MIFEYLLFKNSDSKVELKIIVGIEFFSNNFNISESELSFKKRFEITTKNSFSISNCYVSSFQGELTGNLIVLE